MAETNLRVWKLTLWNLLGKLEWVKLLLITERLQRSLQFHLCFLSASRMVRFIFTKNLWLRNTFKRPFIKCSIKVQRISWHRAKCRLLLSPFIIWELSLYNCSLKNWGFFSYFVQWETHLILSDRKDEIANRLPFFFHQPFLLLRWIWLDTWLWLLAPPQHLQARSQDLRIRWGQGSNDGCSVC